jgi:hypothetical protein
MVGESKPTLPPSPQTASPSTRASFSRIRTGGYLLGMALSVTELSRIERYNADAARHERILRCAFGLDTLNRFSRPGTFELFSGLDVVSRAAGVMGPPFDYSHLIKLNRAQEAVRAMNVAAGLDVAKWTSALTNLVGANALNPANTLIGIGGLDFAAFGFGFDDPTRTAALTRYWRNADAFTHFARGFDALGSNPIFSSQVVSMNLINERLLGSYGGSFSTLIAGDVFGAINSFTRAFEANPLLLGNAAELLRTHDLLRPVIEDGLELSWDELQGEARGEPAEWLRQPFDLVERERRTYIVGVVYATAQAADAFAHANVPMGITHTAFAMFCLQRYWELRRL